MPCTRPRHVYPAPPDAANRRPVSASSRSYAGAKAFKIPCGRCDSCNSDRARDWATRSYLHSTLETHKYFLTLTISDEKMLPHRGLMKRSLQLFMKRARSHYGDFVGETSFLGCGEYGGDTLRAHYHLLLFGIEIDDLVPAGRGKRGDTLFSSATINRLWPWGHVMIGHVTYETCAYVAGYLTKKLGKGSDDPAYARHEINRETGEIRSWQVQPEFLLSSRRPAIGREWFERFKGDVYPSGFLVIDGRRVPAPRYFDRLLAESELLRMKVKRRQQARLRPEEQTEWRLSTKDESRRLRLERHLRDMGAAV